MRPLSVRMVAQPADPFVGDDLGGRAWRIAPYIEAPSYVPSSPLSADCCAIAARANAPQGSAIFSSPCTLSSTIRISSSAK